MIFIIILRINYPNKKLNYLLNPELFYYENMDYCKIWVLTIDYLKTIFFVYCKNNNQ